MSKKYEVLYRISTDSVFKHTKRHWGQWVELLNQSGAHNLSHQDLVAFLKKKYKLNGWWQQAVAIGYETAIGKRIEGRNLKGEYTLSASKTFPIGAKELWKFLASPNGIEIWLKPLSEFTIKPKSFFEAEGGIFGEVRTMKEGERLRMTWQDTDWAKPSILQLWLVGRSKNKSILVFNHERLQDSRSKVFLKEHWKQVLSELHMAISSEKT